MEEKTWESDSIPAMVFVKTMNFLGNLFSHISSLSSDPLFSSIVSLCAIILLYFPRIFLVAVFSPVLILTGFLLLALLRLGAVQGVDKESNSAEPGELDSRDEDHKWVECQPETEPVTKTEFVPNPFFLDSFVEWNVRAPLEVIYEEYEGEEDDGASNEKEETQRMGIERFPSLSLCYPESDTDSSSDGDFPGIGRWDSLENLCFRWDDDDREGLIEIALDDKQASDFQVEEENLIEIDISQARNDEFPG